MSAAKVKEYLKKYNMDNRIITVPTTSATVKDVVVTKKQSQVIGEEITI